jgi:Xaa-Pro aminopeptidase
MNFLLHHKSMNLIETLAQRRQKLAQIFPYPVLLWSGVAPARNFPANRYRFRASSHFLYFAGLNLENAIIYLEKGELTLLMDDASPSAALWHGEAPSSHIIGEKIGAKAIYPLSHLVKYIDEAATIAVQDAITYQKQYQALNRQIIPEGKDLQLIKAIIELRLMQDQFALQEMQKAADIAVKAHLAGIKGTKTAKTESEIRAIMEGVIIGQNMTCSYNSIVTIQGEILHNEVYKNNLKTGDLLLADVGAETNLGYASDITRTWPVSGKFSSTQRDIYEIVWAAQKACITKIKAGIEYQEIHILGCLILAEGLAYLGILQGNPENLVEMDAHALFFPHGIGHLLGLDVHDMEDLGDLAGYAAGRSRSQRFGLGYLRLNRPLSSGMVVTIEPGFYQVPAILQDSNRREQYQNVVNWEKLAKFEDVRGIRIEDDVLVTETGSQILTASLPSGVLEIVELMRES